MKYYNSYYDDETVERVLMHGHRLVDEMCTIREVAEHSGFSKTTVHKDLVEKLSCIDGKLYEEVKIVLDLNKEESAHRGGQATKKKYRKKD